jgi:hypothetical protein
LEGWESNYQNDYQLIKHPIKKQNQLQFNNLVHFWKLVIKATSFLLIALTLKLKQGSYEPLKWQESNLMILGFHLGNSNKKCQFNVASMESYKIYYREEDCDFSQV